MKTLPCDRFRRFIIMISTLFMPSIFCFPSFQGDAAEPKLLRQYGLGTVSYVVYSPLGQTFLSAGSNGTAYLWDERSGKVIRQFSRHTAPITSMAFSADGKKIVTGGLDSKARLWDANSGSLIRTFAGHAGPVLAVAFSPNGSRVVTGSADKTARIWNAANGTLLFTLVGHTGAVAGVAVSPDNSKILTGSTDGKSRIWNATTGISVQTLNAGGALSMSYAGISYPRICVSFSPDGATGLINDQLWDIASGVSIRTFPSNQFAAAFTNSIFSPDGNQVLLSGSYNENGNSVLCDVHTGNKIKYYNTITPQLSARFSPDGNRILIASQALYLDLFDLSTSNKLKSFLGHSSGFPSMALSPDGSRLIAGNGHGGTFFDAQVFMYDVSTASLIRAFGNINDYPNYVASEYYAIAFTSDGTKVAGLNNNRPYIWYADTGSGVYDSSGQWSLNGQYYLTFSPDGRWLSIGRYVIRLATDGSLIPGGFEIGESYAGAFSSNSARLIQGANGPAYIWSLQTKSILKTLIGHGAGIHAVAFSPDGSRALTGSDDKTAKLWNASTGALIRTFTGHGGAITSVAYSPDGGKILTGSKDHTARLWDANTGAPQFIVTRHTDEVSAVLFTLDGGQFLTSSLDGTVLLWEIPAPPKNQVQNQWQWYD